MKSRPDRLVGSLLRATAVEKKVLAGLGLAILAVLLMGAVLYQSSRRFLKQELWVDQAHAVQRRLGSALLNIEGVQTGARGYALTGNEYFLLPYRSALAPLEQDLHELRRLTADNPAQQQHLDLLEPLLRARIADAEQVIRLRREEGLQAAAEYVTAGSGKRLMDQIRELVRTMEEDEGRILENRRNQQAANARAMQWLFLALMAAVAGLLAVVYFLILRDVAERKRLHAELEAANQELGLRNREVERATQLKSQFLASMSHELRTPMNAILGFSELLSDEIPGTLNEKQKHFVQRIRDGGQHLLRLINDILDLSKIEAGRVDLRMEDFSLAEVLPEVLSNLRSLAMARRVKLEAQPGPLRVHADRLRFKQVLYNLLSNAVKFTPEGGRVGVESVQEGDFVRISVADTGVGIAEQDLEIIFEEFRQAGGTTRGLKEGTGLGLAITRRLVEQHGGRVWAESKPGEGSRFHFTLPVAKEPQVRQAVAAARAATDAKPMVLVVDDEPAARELLAGFLAPEGFQVEAAQSGREAVDKAVVLVPDVITLNMLTPGRGGLEALWELKSNPVTAAIPVIIVSIADQRKMGFAMGAADYLLKPISKQTLLQAVQRQLVATGRQQTVLVVDDDAEALEMMTTVLQAAGYRCLAAEGGGKALEILEQARPDGILLDLMMPEVDGFEVIRQIKEKPALRDIPIFVLSAKELTPSETALLARETRAFFHKGTPWKEELLAHVRKAVAGTGKAGE